MNAWRRAVRWFSATLPLAGLAWFAYVAFEWLFFVTKPSAVGALPLSRQLAVLGQAPVPLLPLLVALQAAASLLSVLAYPRWRTVALLPAAVIGGALLLVLGDNFTYTLFGFGVLTSGPVMRIVYAAALPALVVLAWHRLAGSMHAVGERRGSAVGGLALSAVLLYAPTIADRPAPPADLSAPPSTAAAAGGSARPNILILGIDGVDAQALSAYGYTRETSPYLSVLREESLFFENAFSNVGRTHGSLVALLSGRLPFSTRVTFPPTILQGDDAHRHLPGLLKARGYSTLQLGMRHYADAEDANLQGFDAANYRWQDLGRVAAGTAANDEAAIFRRDVAERIDERVGHLFGFRHAIDSYAHVEGRRESPYWKDERRVETLVRYLPAAPEPWFVHTHFLDTHCCAYRPKALVFSGDDKAQDARDSQLREADDHIRTVVESLRASGRLERTILVITSDHTNGWTTKGRVPLLIRFPGGALRGRVSANVQLADVAPTLLAYLGEPVPAWMDGVSLLAPEALDPARPIFAVSDVAGRHAEGFLTTALDDAGPPNYGAGTVTMVAGARWYELSLEDGTVRHGDVPEHTEPERRPVTVDDARVHLRRVVDRAGFQIRTTSHD